MNIFKRTIHILFFISLIFITMSVGFSANVSIKGVVNEYTPYEEVVSFNLECDEKITFSFPEKARNIRFENGTSINNKEDYIVEGCDRKGNIRYTLDIAESSGKKTVRIERTFSRLKGINYSYSLSIPSGYVVDINRTTPSNFDIKHGKRNEIIFPKNNIYLVYLKEYNEENVLTYQKFSEEISEFAVVVLVIISMLIGYLLSEYVNYQKRKKISSNFVPSYVLSEEERNVLSVIKSNPGINNKDISRELNYSKSRVSYLINELESKELIRKEKFGRSFRIYLEKDIK